MKNTLFYLIAILTIVSCSKDDDDSSSTFLETYDNTVWKFEYTINDGGFDHKSTTYIRFKNNLKEPFGYWNSYQMSTGDALCFNYINFGLESNTVDIIENSKDSFIMRAQFDLPGHYLTFSFIKNGDSIDYEYKESENGRNDIFLSKGIKSTVAVGSLTICN